MPSLQVAAVACAALFGTEIAVKVANHCYALRALHHHANHANDPTCIAVQVFGSKPLMLFREECASMSFLQEGISFVWMCDLLLRSMESHGTISTV